MQEVFEKIKEMLLFNEKDQTCPDLSCWEHSSKDCDKCDLREIRIRDVIDIINQVAKEYSHGHFGCNSNGEHEKCDGCGMAPTCKEKYKHWFGVQDKKDGWIPCSERLPEEHDSIFAKRKGTDKWDDAMFEKTSDVVNVTVVDKDGKGVTTHARTVDGKWSCDLLRCNKSYRIIAWQPLPAPYRPDENIEQNQMQSSAWKEHMMGRFMKGE